MVLDGSGGSNHHQISRNKLIGSSGGNSSSSKHSIHLGICIKLITLHKAFVAMEPTNMQNMFSFYTISSFIAIRTLLCTCLTENLVAII